MNELEKLIGKQFKRNVYGLSNWTKTINHISVSWSLNEIEGIAIGRPIITVYETLESQGFDLGEIVFVGSDIDKSFKMMEFASAHFGKTYSKKEREQKIKAFNEKYYNDDDDNNNFKPAY